MVYYVYILLSKDNPKKPTYVGYTKNLSIRLKLHNSSKGAKFTRGRQWEIIYKKAYKSKVLAMKNEYMLKKDVKKRKKIKNEYLNKI
ncbi:GIY-YIG nuclease family protein [Candidatus Pelagibacter sp.]|uniref:GIY-YIG nuclease family protein n=1 Tax=Candidatus Pelagibacter sp. TaxID=2024849 RepID=UPI003F87444E